MGASEIDTAMGLHRDHGEKMPLYDVKRRLGPLARWHIILLER